jgi:hypothetical protein
VQEIFSVAFRPIFPLRMRRKKIGPMQDMHREEIAVVLQDGIASKITVFTGEPAPDVPVFICMPAMGSRSLPVGQKAGSCNRKDWLAALS